MELQGRQDSKMPINDEKIVDLYWARDEKAIEETDLKYRKYLYTVAYNIVHDRLDSEECLNDTYLGAWHAMPPSRPNVLKAFLTVIARRIAVKRYHGSLRHSEMAVKTSFENGEITPPHIRDHGELENTVNGIFGWYAKTDRGVIGIVRVTWCYVSDKYDLHFDDAYYIIEQGSDLCRAVDRDDLLEILGDFEKTYIYTGEYNEYGKYSDVVYPTI